MINMPYKDIIKRKEMSKIRWLKWASLHPKEAKDRYLRHYYKYFDFMKKHHRVQEDCYNHNLPSPHRKVEEWNGENIKVSREANGRFITWLKR